MTIPLVIGFSLSLCLPANAGEKDDFDTEVKRLEKEWNKPIETVFNDTGKIIDFEDQILKRLQKAVKAVNDKL